MKEQCKNLFLLKSARDSEIYTDLLYYRRGNQIAFAWYVKKSSWPASMCWSNAMQRNNDIETFWSQGYWNNTFARLRKKYLQSTSEASSDTELKSNKK